jgi:hypothetical protein
MAVVRGVRGIRPRRDRESKGAYLVLAVELLGERALLIAGPVGVGPRVMDKHAPSSYPTSPFLAAMLYKSKEPGFAVSSQTQGAPPDGEQRCAVERANCGRGTRHDASRDSGRAVGPCCWPLARGPRRETRAHCERAHFFFFFAPIPAAASFMAFASADCFFLNAMSSYGQARSSRQAGDTQFLAPHKPRAGIDSRGLMNRITSSTNFSFAFAFFAVPAVDLPPALPGIVGLAEGRLEFCSQQNMEGASCRQLLALRTVPLHTCVHCSVDLH